MEIGMDAEMVTWMEIQMAIPTVIQLDQKTEHLMENLMDASKEHPTVIAMAY